MESIFQRVKSVISPKQAAARYGLNVLRGDWVCCPFHHDRHPSMKLYPDHYHCFSCKATGDVINLTAELLQVSPYEAARKLESDFNAGYRSVIAQVNAPARKHIALSLAQILQLSHATDVLRSARDVLEDWKSAFAPRTPDEYWDPHFVEACHRLPLIEYMLDLACSPDDKDRLFLITEFGKEVEKLEQSVFRRGTEGNGTSAKLSA